MGQATIHNVYDQIAEVLSILEPEKIMALAPSKELQLRFDFLNEKLKTETLNRSEKDELHHFIVLERLFRLSKIRADISLRKSAES